jgi:hypothetical protein
MTASPKIAAETKPAHTPGPWAVDAPFPVVTANKDGRPVVIADAQYRNNEHPGAMVMKDEGMANARLIAAAPELFEACASVWAALADADDPKLQTIAAECRAALSKTGA